MTDVGIRDLRDHLSRYLERAAGGEEIIVTDRGRAIARLVPFGGERTIDRLIREGKVRPAQRPKGPLPKPIKAKGSVSEFVAEQRG